MAGGSLAIYDPNQLVLSQRAPGPAAPLKPYRAVFRCTKSGHIPRAKQPTPAKLLLEVAALPKPYRGVFPCTKSGHIPRAKQPTPAKLLLEVAALPKPYRGVFPCTKSGHTLPIERTAPSRPHWD